MAEADSPLVAALKTRKRQAHTFDGQIAGLETGPMVVWVPTIGEEVQARIDAAVYQHRNLGSEIESQESTGTDLTTVNIIATALRRADDPDGLPAAPFIELLQRLKAEDVTAILACIEEARARESGRSREMNEDEAVELALALSDATPELAAEMVSHLDRTTLLSFCQTLSSRFAELLFAMATGNGGDHDAD